MIGSFARSEKLCSFSTVNEGLLSLEIVQK